MAYGKWSLTTEEEKYFIPLFKYMIDELTSGRRTEFDLSGKGINPWQAKKVMEQLGYTSIQREENGWEQDMWIYFKNSPIYLYSCGQTFELMIGIENNN
jgi:hypothetical protein